MYVIFYYINEIFKKKTHFNKIKYVFESIVTDPVTARGHNHVMNTIDVYITLFLNYITGVGVYFTLLFLFKDNFDIYMHYIYFCLLFLFWL